MTAIRVHEEHQTVLDFSNGKHSKNKIKRTLGECKFRWMEEDTLFINKIKVGMYSIELFSFENPPGYLKLKDCQSFDISIRESNSSKDIPLDRDPRFRNQYWVNYNSAGKLRMKHLVDVIIHCQRLDRLKAVL